MQIRLRLFPRRVGAVRRFFRMTQAAFVALYVMLLPVVATAGVNLKNGNFFITFTDIVTPAGAHGFSMSRTYNSKSTQSLSFGYGWGGTWMRG